MKYLKICTLAMSSFLLFGCGLNHLGQQVEVRLEPDVDIDPWTQEIKEQDFIIITSLADQTVNVQGVSINRGACKNNFSGNSKQLTRYGSFLKVQLTNCNIMMVKEVKLTLQGTDYIYNF